MTVVPSTGNKDRATLTIISGINAGQVFALDGTDHVIGRGTEADLWVEDGGVSRRHARDHVSLRRSLLRRGPRLDQRHVHRRQRVDVCEVRPNDRIQLGPHVILRFAITDDAEEELQRRLYESSTRDGLTRLYNRKYFTERLTAEVAYSRRHKVKLAVMLLDLDDFKQINDTYGHLAGDMVLRLVAAQMQRLLRVEDLVARYGGEEFVILARSTGKTEAIRLAERIRDVDQRARDPRRRHSIQLHAQHGRRRAARRRAGRRPERAPRARRCAPLRAKAEGKNRVCRRRRMR